MHRPRRVCLMPVTLVCPACDSDVPAASPSGSVRCPTCWGKVTVESARRKPADTPPPRGDAAPLARRAVGPGAPDPAKAPRPRRPAKVARGRVWVVAAVVLVLAAAGGFVAFTALTPPPEPSEPPPPIAKPAEPPPPADWTPVTVAEGATLVAPGPLTKQAVTVDGQAGVVHAAADETATARVFVFDLKGDGRADREEFLARLLQVSDAKLSREGVRPIPGGDALEYSASDASGFDHTALVIGRRGRWFVFHVRWKPEDDPKGRRRGAFVAKAGVTWPKPEKPTPPPTPGPPRR